jgi:hypothetical protein
VGSAAHPVGAGTPARYTRSKDPTFTAVTVSASAVQTTGDRVSSMAATSAPPLTALPAADGVARRRWPEPLEVALYFVAVESIGNSHKHANARQTVVTLAAGADEVVLEVHDDGRGFELGTESTGSGLQHMADRMAARGSLVVESRPARGPG